jgi:SAM-dependent methyltransferase
MYKFRSPHNTDAHEVKQWAGRTVDGEMEGFQHRTIVRLFDQYLDNKQYKILEGGCGLGGWCKWLNQRGNQTTGLEYNHNVVELARRLQPDIHVELGDVTQIAYPDNSFDVYISLGVIEHFEKGPEQVLKEAHRVLRPGGLAFVSTPYLSLFRRLLAHPIRTLYFLVHKLRKRPDYFWEYRFTKRELENYLTKGGFQALLTEIDDYESSVRDRHMGLWTDWYFLRAAGGKIWELNRLGRLCLYLLKPIPRSWYCAGIVLVAKAEK